MTDLLLIIIILILVPALFYFLLNIVLFFLFLILLYVGWKILAAVMGWLWDRLYAWSKECAKRAEERKTAKG